MATLEQIALAREVKACDEAEGFPGYREMIMRKWRQFCFRVWSRGRPIEAAYGLRIWEDGRIEPMGFEP